MSARKRIAALVVAMLTLLIGVSVSATSSSARPYNHNGVIGCSPLKPSVGGQVTIQGNDFLPNDHVVIALHSKVTNLGSADANANGDFSTTVQLPAGVKGPHTLVVTGTGGPPKDQASCPINIGARGTGGTGTGGNNHGGGSSNTGVQIAGIGLLGLALIAGGVFFLLSARKRRTAETD